VDPRRDDLVVTLAALIPLALYLLREQAIAGASGFPLDDSWIHLHFARNIAEGAGFSYNPGTPVAGSTAPLWTLLLAAGALAMGPSPVVAKTIGVASMIGAALLTRRAALAWGASRIVGQASAVALLWTGPMAWGALSGMEVCLAALLVAAALAAHAGGRAGWTALWGALAVLARPEALLLVPLLALGRPLGVRRALLFGAVTVVAVAPVVAFTLLTVGAPLPATASAKIEGGVVGWVAGLGEPLGRTLVARPWEFSRDWVAWLARTHWLLPLALAPAIVLAWIRHGRVLGVPALGLLVHPLGMALLAPYRGPGFQEGRYSAHVLPLAMIVLAVALGTGAVGATVVAGPARPAWTVGGLRKMLRGSDSAYSRARVIAVVLYLAVALATLPGAATRYAWGVQNINAMQVHLGRWVDANVPSTARLAVNDIGAIAYFSRREVIDLMGLVTPEIIPYRRQGEAEIMRYVTTACPDYVIIFPTWFPAMAARADLLVPVYRVRLARNEVAGGSEMVVYRLVQCTV